MNSDAGFLRLTTKLGFPSFIQLGILSADFGLGECSSEDQCTGNSQSLQSGAIILRQRVLSKVSRGEGDTP